MWIPDSKGIYPDLLATSGDYLRVWRAGEPETKLECLLNNNKNSDFCAPLTSFDWNEVDPNLLGTSSIDTTCTVWGLETDQVWSRFVISYLHKHITVFLPDVYPGSWIPDPKTATKERGEKKFVSNLFL